MCYNLFIFFVEWKKIRSLSSLLYELSDISTVLSPWEHASQRALPLTEERWSDDDQKMFSRRAPSTEAGQAALHTGLKTSHRLYNFSFWQHRLLMGESLLQNCCVPAERAQWLLLTALAAGNNRMLKIWHSGCIQVDEWIELGTISLPIEGSNLSQSLLNRDSILLWLA